MNYLKKCIMTQDELDYLMGMEDFARYIFIEKGLYFHHSDDKHHYFCKSSKSKKPELRIKFNSNQARYVESNTFFYQFVYSFEDYQKIEKCDFDRIQERIGKEVDNILYDFSGGKLKNKVILANEGTGKSKAVLDRIEPGHIYSAPDKSILKEKESYLDDLGKKYIRFHSNGDIIYTVISECRGDTEESREIAKKIVHEYIKSFDTSNILVDAKKVNQLISKYDNYLKEEGMDKFLSDLDDTSINELSSNKENVISLLAFLEDNKKIKENEKVAILEYHKYLISEMFRGKSVITCTTHKLKILLQKMNYGRDLLVFSDEIVPDVHGNAIGLNNHNKNYGLLYGFAKVNEFEFSDEKTLNIINGIKKKKGVKDWAVFSSYNTPTGGHNTLIELKDDKWKYVNRFSMIILSTEEKTKLIFPDFEFIDLRHFIKSDELTFLVVDGLNKRENDRLFKGNARPIITKTITQKMFNIENDFFIGDGIGNSLLNNTFNHTNVKGRNTFIEKLKKTNEINIGISLMNPHPEAINLIKGYIYNANYDSINKQEKTPNNLLMDYEENIISVIGTDQINQAIGRANGYRFTSKENKTYVVVNSNMMKKIRPFYYTERVFKLTRFRDCKWLRKEFPKEHLFLETINTILKLKDDANIPELDENMSNKTFKKLSDLIETKLKQKYKVENLSFFSYLKLFKDNLVRYIELMKSKLNNITYVPQLVKEIVKYTWIGCNDKVKDMFESTYLKNVLNIIKKSKLNKKIEQIRAADLKNCRAIFTFLYD